MIKIFIQGMKDGVTEVAVEAAAEETPSMCPEFFGTITLSGSLRKIGRRLSFTGAAECDAKLICDLSLSEYVERIYAEIKASFLIENLHSLSSVSAVSGESEETVIIGDDCKYIDLTEIVREELTVNLPLKRIAPDFRDKNFEDIYPQYSSENERENIKEIDDRWSALKNVKLNSLNNN